MFSDPTTGCCFERRTQEEGPCSGTQFTGFTSTKVQILTPEGAAARDGAGEGGVGGGGAGRGDRRGVGGEGGGEEEEEERDVEHQVAEP